MYDIEIKKGLKKHTVRLYDNIEQMPIERFNKVNKYWMLDDNIGSSISDFDKAHYAKFMLLLDNKEKMAKELENFRILVYNIMNEVNVSHYSFACMVHSIDGVEKNDLSENGLKVVLKELSDLGFTQEALKKKPKTTGKRFTTSYKNYSQTSFGRWLGSRFGRNKRKG